jgi:hypothetical protein
VAHVKNNVNRLDVFPFAAGKREALAERWPAPHKAQKPRAQIGGNADAYASTRDGLSLYLGATAGPGEQACRSGIRRMPFPLGAEVAHYSALR